MGHHRTYHLKSIRLHPTNDRRIMRPGIDEDDSVWIKPDDGCIAESDIPEINSQAIVTHDRPPS
jgi:hypothetical protein